MLGLLTIAIRHNPLARSSLRERMLRTSKLLSEPVVSWETVEGIHSTECACNDARGIVNSVPFLHLIALVVHSNHVNAS